MMQRSSGAAESRATHNCRSVFTTRTRGVHPAGRAFGHYVSMAHLQAWRASAVALVLTACSAADSPIASLASVQLCTLIGFSSFIEVDTSGTGWEVSELCLDGDCSVPPPVSDIPADYSYRLTLRSADGESIERNGVVRTESFRVNGTGCDPVTANAVLVVASSGAVTAKPMSLAHP